MTNIYLQKKIIITGFISLILIMVSSSVFAGKIIPRLGVAGGVYWTEDNMTANYDHDGGMTSTYGVNGGVVYATPDNYFDLSFDGLNYKTTFTTVIDYNLPNSGWRSELNMIYGHRLFARVYLFGGYRDVSWGPSLFKDNGSKQKGVFLGVNLNNIEFGSTLFSLSLAQFEGKYKMPEGTADAEGFLMRASWREKDSHNLWSIKWSQIGTLINDVPLTLGYTYLFY